MTNPRILVSLFGLLLVTGCQQITDRVFGETVPINPNDTTPPNVELIVPEEYLFRLYTSEGSSRVESDVRVSTIGAYARAGNLTNPTDNRSTHQLAYTVVGSDPDGVRAVIASNILVTPFCAREPNNQAPAPPWPFPQTPYFVAGKRTERSRLMDSATTRLPLRHEFSIQLNVVSEHCPDERPLLTGAVVELRGAALNFNVGPLVETEPVYIDIGLAGRASASGYNPGSGSYCIPEPGERCPDP